MKNYIFCVLIGFYLFKIIVEPENAMIYLVFLGLFSLIELSLMKKDNYAKMTSHLCTVLFTLLSLLGISTCSFSLGTQAGKSLEESKKETNVMTQESFYSQLDDEALEFLSLLDIKDKVYNDYIRYTELYPHLSSSQVMSKFMIQLRAEMKDIIDKKADLINVPNKNIYDFGTELYQGFQNNYQKTGLCDYDYNLKSFIKILKAPREEHGMISQSRIEEIYDNIVMYYKKNRLPLEHLDYISDHGFLKSKDSKSCKISLEFFHAVLSLGEDNYADFVRASQQLMDN